jgi:hypothetical protein
MSDSSVELLLIELFDADELRRFVRKLENSPELISELPGKNVSGIAFAYEVARLLERRGEIGSEFFRLLECERPKQVHKIRACAAGYRSEPPNAWRSTRRRPRPTSAFVVIALLIAIPGIIALVAIQGQNTAAQEASTVITACTIACKGCHGMTRAWVVLPVGEIFVVETDGNRLTFRCLPEGTPVSVVIEISDGVANLRFASAKVTLQSGVTELPAASFTPGLPDGIFFEEGTPRRRESVRHAEVEREMNGAIKELATETTAEIEIIIDESGVSTATSISGVDPSADSEADPPTLTPTVATGNDVYCKKIRRDTISAVDRAAWKKVISLTGSSCWKGYTQALELRVNALKEFGKFQLCVDVGKDSKTPRIQKIVDFCRARLAQIWR